MTISEENKELKQFLQQNIYRHEKRLSNVPTNADHYYNKEDERPKYRPEKMARAIKEHTPIITFMDTDESWWYENGIYNPNAEAIVKMQIVKRLGENIYRENTHYSPVKNLIKPITYIDREDTEAPPELVCLKNGILNVRTQEVTPHTPEACFFTQINAEYKKEADCPKIKAFLIEVMKEQDIPLFQEWCGFILYRSYFIHKSLLLIGGGRNGKGLTLQILQHFLGPGNYATISIQELEKDQWAAADLEKKMANLCDELPSTKLSNAEKFKAVTGNSVIRAQRKNQQPFKFRNYAKMIFSTNQPPRFEDDTDALFSRFCLIEFPYKFVLNPVKKNEKKRRPESEVLNGLFSEQEMSGFLNWALVGLNRLIEKKDFSNSVTEDEFRSLYRRISDPIAAFVMDCLEYDDSIDGFAFKEDVYRAYVDYCKISKVVPQSENVFFKEIMFKFEPGAHIRSGQTTVREDGKDRRVRILKGIVLNISSLFLGFTAQGAQAIDYRQSQKMNLEVSESAQTQGAQDTQGISIPLGTLKHFRELGNACAPRAPCAGEKQSFFVSQILGVAVQHDKEGTVMDPRPLKKHPKYSKAYKYCLEKGFLNEVKHDACKITSHGKTQIK